MRPLLLEFIELVLERNRQAQLSGDRSTEWGSDDHVSDLEARCAEMTYWRDKHPRGSERRGHYKNVLGHLKRELQSARKTQARRLSEKQRVEDVE